MQGLAAGRLTRRASPLRQELCSRGLAYSQGLVTIYVYIKTSPDGLTNLPPSKVLNERPLTAHTTASRSE